MDLPVRIDCVLHQLDTLRSALTTVAHPAEPSARGRAAADAAPSAGCPEDVAEFVSADAPAGWDTVVGYLARHAPALLRIMDRLPSSTEEGGHPLTASCRRLGITPVTVAAPPLFVAHGIAAVSAFPVRLLADHFAR